MGQCIFTSSPAVVGPARRLIAGLVLCCTLSPAWAAPGDILFEDNLNNFGNWTEVSGGGDASIGNETSASGRSMRLRWDTVSAVSDPFNANVPGAEFSVWIRRGDDSFSENPETGEDLAIEYLSGSGSWEALETLPGDGTPGEIIEPTYTLPPDALHGSLQLRFTLTSGSGSDFDYWHVDDVAVTETAAPSPIPVGTCDDFESGLGNWSVSGSGDAGISGQTFNSASNSLYTRWAAVTVMSNPVDFSSASNATVTAWIRRGDDSFSENPEAGEDLVVEYFSNAGTWVELETFAGGDTPGETFTRSYTLPADAQHADFRLRIRQTGGSGSDFDYWHVDDVCFLNPSLDIVAYYAMDEDAWTGSAGEVTDSSGGGLHGQAVNGPTTDNATPAIAGDPGTCRYGVFDGSDDHVEIADDAALDISGELTVATWINPDTLPGSGLMTVLSKDENYEFHVTPGGEINWWWNNSGGDTRQITTSGANIDPAGGWYHIAIVYSQTNGEQTIYVNGVARGSDNLSEALATNADPLQIASDQNFAGRYFDGLIDETYVYNQPLSGAQVASLRDRTHPCGGLNAYYMMDEAAWSGSGSVTDSSGNDNHANPVGGVSTDSATPATPGDPGTCGYGVFPSNTSTAAFDAVDSTLTPAVTGGITFWYNSNADWGVDDQMLLDASADLGNPPADKHFFLVKRNNGALRFRLEDSDDNVSQAETGSQGFGAGAWVHIAVGWDLNNDRLEIYVNGTLTATSSANLNATPAAWNSVYIGDNRSDGVGGNGYTGNSANGLIDEVRFYATPPTGTQVNDDMNATHPCVVTDHFDLNHDGTAVTCQAEPVTVEAHLDDHSVDTGYTGLLSLSTATGNGDWTLVSGGGTLNNGTADDGAATYDMVAGDGGVVGLALKDTTVETTNINVTDGSISETTGTAQAAEDADLVFAESGFQFLADGTAGAIGPQIADKPSDTAPGAQALELQAIRTSDSTGACEAALAGTADIELAFECRDPATCTANQVTINGTPVAGNAAGSVGSYTAVTLDFGDATDTTATFVMNYPDAGEIQLHARYNIPLDDGSGTPSGNFMTGASNAFAVRPFGFHVTAAGNPGAAGPAGAAFTQAGADFTVNATAVLWQAADDADANGIPDGHAVSDTDPTNNADLSDNPAALNYGQETATETVALRALLDQPAGGNDPGLTGTTTIATFAGGAGSTTVQYGEAGIVEITAQLADADYLGAGNASGKSGYVGRFYPDRFQLSGGMLTERVDRSCSPASTFSYMDEILRLEFTLTAQNTAGTTTQNYEGNFAYLDPTVISALNIGAIDIAGPTPLTGRITEDSSTGAWTGGVADIFARASLARDTAPDGPFADLDWGVAPVDSDGVALGSYNLDVNDDGTDDHGLVANGEARFGRLFLESTAGSELLPLTLPLHVEHWAGAGFTQNTDDNCSTYDATNLSFSNRVGLSADPTAAGSGTFTNGTYDPNNPVTLDSNNEQGSVDATYNAPAYLHYDWDNDGNHDNDPTSKATFGIYDPDQRQIYTREVY